MGIDKYLILTLEKSQHRQWAMLGGAAAMNIPLEKIRFVYGHDDEGMGLTEIADAAAADGFPYVRNFALGYADERYGLQQSVGAVCQAWNYGRILRYIATGKETCMISWDDRLPTLPFVYLDTITAELQKLPKFYLWQLRLRFGNWENFDTKRLIYVHSDLIDDVAYYKKLWEADYEACDRELNQKWISDFQVFQERHVNSRQYDIRSDPDTYMKEHIQKGMMGFDESLVLSPVGAAWLLSEALEMETIDPEDPPKSDEHWDQYILRRNSFDTWMVSDLPAAIETAISDGKGLYCPSQVGYRYIEDWLPMGSGIQWMTPEAGENKLRENATRPIFEEVL